MSRTNEPVQLLIGSALNQATGQAVTCSRTPSEVLEVLLEHQREGLPDAWVIAADARTTAAPASGGARRPW